ncbi:MAG: hypothetical protein JRJ78_01075 [Deltaproteobacteria bacterium]|nr:hypothetical protein [Deltaproteobacteria bacterium]MBW2015269.1 hypothetical protein [Deltaproteobacteria bacterium]
MKVQSTGLGKTVMVADLKELFKTRFDGEQVLQVTMEATQPLHWTIKVYMGPKDMRKAILIGLKPSVIWKALMALIFGRYSLFPKAPGEPVSETAPGEKAEPAVPPKPEPAPAANEAVNPLARLKG